MSKIYHYYVEGECEEVLINCLKKNDINILLSGKVDVFNFINKRITPNRLAVLPKDTVIILVYDIDVKNTEILEYNLNILNKYGFNEIIHIQSVNNFEDEIIYSTNISNINELFNTTKSEEFKKKFINHANLKSKLDSVKFNSNKLWSRVNKKAPFNRWSNKNDLNIIKK